MEEDYWPRGASPTRALSAVPAGKLSHIVVGTKQEASSSEKPLSATQIKDIFCANFIHWVPVLKMVFHNVSQTSHFMTHVLS